jgi:sugar lactone lactonase YvrE
VKVLAILALLLSGCHVLLPLEVPRDRDAALDQATSPDLARLDATVDQRRDHSSVDVLKDLGADAPVHSDLGTGHTVKTLAGTGTAGFKDHATDPLQAQFFKPHDVEVDFLGRIYVADFQNYCIRRIVGKKVETLAGTCTQPGSTDGAGTAARFSTTCSVTLDPKEQHLYVTECTGHRVRRITLSTGQVTTIAGTGSPDPPGKDGPALQATFNAPDDVAVIDEADGMAIYVVEYHGQRLRKIKNGVVTTVAGTGQPGKQDGPLSTATFSNPHMMVLDGPQKLYIAGDGSHSVRLVDLAKGLVSTVAGDGNAGYKDGPASTARFQQPTGLAPGPKGRYLYVSDGGGNRVRVVDLVNNMVGTLAGDGSSGGQDGPAAAATFADPHGMALDKQGRLYVTEFLGHRIRVIEP